MHSSSRWSGRADSSPPAPAAALAARRVIILWPWWRKILIARTVQAGRLQSWKFESHLAPAGGASALPPCAHLHLICKAINSLRCAVHKKSRLQQCKHTNSRSSGATGWALHFTARHQLTSGGQASDRRAAGGRREGCQPGGRTGELLSLRDARRAAGAAPRPA